MRTETLPVFIVSTGSMCIPYDGACDGWSHPFDRTLHVGDLIIIEGVNPKDLNTNYPNSDIIVFQNPADQTGTPIVHRITSEVIQGGKYYFYTKGDGNPPAPWPSPAEKYAPDLGWYTSNYYDQNPTVPKGSIPQNLIIGKVVMRIPWLGWITIAGGSLQAWMAQRGISIGIPIIVLFVVLIVVFEFAVPYIKRKKLIKA